MFIYGVSGVTFNGRFNVPTKIKNAGESELALLFSNDPHAKVGKLPNLKTARDEFISDFKDSDASNIVVTTGDNFISKPSKVSVVLTEFLNKFFKPEYQVLGNHEFDNGSSTTAEVIKNLDSPTLGANIQVAKNKLFKELKKTGKLANSAIWTNKGNKFGFIGVSPSDLALYKSEEELQGIKIADINKTKKAVKAEVKKLQQNGVKNIILLSHMGYVPDMLMAGAFENVKSAKELQKLRMDLNAPNLKSTNGVDGIGIIVGAHTHTELKDVVDIKKARRILNNYKSSDFEILNPEEENRIVNFIIPGSGKPVLIAQAGAENKYAGFIDVIFDKNGVIKKNSIVNKLMNVSSFEADKDVSESLSNILGKREELFKLKKPFIDPLRRSENAVQNLIADAVMDAANKELPRADFSLIHGAVARGNLEGKVSNWDLEHDSVAFTENMYMIKLSEKDIVNTINNTAIRTLVSNSKPVLIHPSKQLSYTISKTPEILEDGTKLYVKDIKITDKNGKTRNLNLINPSEEKNFNVVTEEYFLHGDPNTGGKEGFSALGVEGFSKYFKENGPKPGSIIKEYEFTDKSAFIKYLTEKYKGKEIELAPEGRVNIISEEENAILKKKEKRVLL